MVRRVIPEERYNLKVAKNTFVEIYAIKATQPKVLKQFFLDFIFLPD